MSLNELGGDGTLTRSEAPGLSGRFGTSAGSGRDPETSDPLGGRGWSDDDPEMVDLPGSRDAAAVAGETGDPEVGSRSGDNGSVDELDEAGDDGRSGEEDMGLDGEAWQLGLEFKSDY